MDPLKVSMIKKACFYFFTENMGVNESEFWDHWRNGSVRKRIAGLNLKLCNDGNDVDIDNRTGCQTVYSVDGRPHWWCRHPSSSNVFNRSAEESFDMEAIDGINVGGLFSVDWRPRGILKSVVKNQRSTENKQVQFSRRVQRELYVDGGDTFMVVVFKLSLIHI